MGKNGNIYVMLIYILLGKRYECLQQEWDGRSNRTKAGKAVFQTIAMGQKRGAQKGAGKASWKWLVTTTVPLATLSWSGQKYGQSYFLRGRSPLELMSLIEKLASQIKQNVLTVSLRYSRRLGETGGRAVCLRYIPGLVVARLGSRRWGCNAFSPLLRAIVCFTRFSLWYIALTVSHILTRFFPTPSLDNVYPGCPTEIIQPNMGVYYQYKRIEINKKIKSEKPNICRFQYNRFGHLAKQIIGQSWKLAPPPSERKWKSQSFSEE